MWSYKSNDNINHERIFSPTGKDGDKNYPHLSAEEKEFNRQKASAMSKKFGFVTDLTSLVVTTDPLPVEEVVPPSSPTVLILQESNE